MATEAIQLKKANRVEVTTLVDNYTDIFLPDSEHVKRNPIVEDKNVTRGLLADHGLSLLVEVFANGKGHKILLDGGWLEDPVPFNVETLGINLQDVETVVLSHGHQDHFAGLPNLYRKGLLPKDVPLMLHPEVFKQRDLQFPDGRTSRMPQLSRKVFDYFGVEIQEITSPTLFASDFAMLTGEIEMVTDFEVGFPIGRKLEDGQMKPDTEVKDEQSLVFNVKDKGLVVVTACSHPGIINTLLQAQKLTDEKKIYAVIGGFHLTGPWEGLIPRTVEEMKKFSPEILVPTHCTGWNAINAFAKEMPEAFVLNSVGTKYIL
ncbi:MAG: MBL fold metallo-hydrolase [Deltaproteobacteria bacterium]|nr:MBL fold metallo-hydrolase [Deltaproteobacteria bacterium]MBW2202048.1 MBL fold metallo-hydrolase [Deltaproteobacteria bacterium]